ncbi:hypothetical protein DPEC_G00081450 [Dallia pectoralis]|uniref:Uncharacterized protein n=1 Tax=Dallia pectoralis TaxID=75939 RepID=A0ACC2GYX4_DALPE|nr:hypothetical protein DPEC_G00081450 [Dallia pectoralis]
MLFQSAHYSMMQVKAVPSTIACTSTLQTWHRPRTKGIYAEPIQDLVVKKPKPSGRSVCKSTLYQAYTGSLPDPSVLALGKRLESIRPQPLISSVLHCLSELSLVDSRFGPVPRGSPLSYQCPPVVATSQTPKCPSIPQTPCEWFHIFHHHTVCPQLPPVFSFGESNCHTQHCSCDRGRYTRAVEVSIMERTQSNS